MTFAKTAFLSFMSTGLKIINALFIAKLVSLYCGPEGLAKTGQFVSFVYFLVLIAGLGINQGVIKYTAEYKVQKSDLDTLFSTAYFLIIVGAIVCCLLLIIFQKDISLMLFDTSEYGAMIMVLAFGQIFMAFNNFYIAILNGLKEIKKMFAVNLFAVLLGALISLVLIARYALDGVLIAYIISQSLFFFFSRYFCSKVVSLKQIKARFNWNMSSMLLKFSIMSFTSAASATISQMMVRSHMAAKFSWYDVGFWEGVTRISDGYLVLITTTLSVYCLPKFSELNDKTLIVKEFKSILSLIIPATILIASLIFLFRDLIIIYLFSPEFMPMRELFFWQLLGDILRVIGMTFAYFLLAKTMLKVFIFIELFANINFVLLSYVLMEVFGIKGAIYGFAINSLFFLVISLYCSIKKIRQLVN